MNESEEFSNANFLRLAPQNIRAFPTTQWSVVLGAGGGDLTLAAAALERLCCNYWHPVYAFIRYRGFNPHDAEDSTQSFFAFLLENETLKKVDQQKGKFRSFLLATLNNFLANQWDKQQALKRGGGRKIISMNDTGESAFISEPVDKLSPEKFFERHWAMTLVDHVLVRLKKEYAESGKMNLFIRLEPELTNESNPELYAGWAMELGMTEGALQVALHRLRRRFGDLLRSEIAHTVARPEDVEDEIRELVAAIAG